LYKHEGISKISSVLPDAIDLHFFTKIMVLRQVTLSAMCHFSVPISPSFYLGVFFPAIALFRDVLNAGAHDLSLHGHKTIIPQM